MSRWYTTVGVPGGEYAVREEDGKEAHKAILYALDEAYFSMSVIVEIRPASPELAEWLDTATHTGSEPSMMLRQKVAGGWIAHCGINEEFYLYIPVAGAAGITVIGETE